MNQKSLRAAENYKELYTFHHYKFFDSSGNFISINIIGVSTNNHLLIDKERYEKELRALESHSDMLKKPKKCLSAYMIFVKETRPLIVDAHPEMGALQVMQQVGK